MRNSHATEQDATEAGKGQGGDEAGSESGSGNGANRQMINEWKRR